jgi:hypothetical protein
VLALSLPKLPDAHVSVGILNVESVLSLDLVEAELLGSAGLIGPAQVHVGGEFGAKVGINSSALRRLFVPGFEVDRFLSLEVH